MCKFGMGSNDSQTSTNRNRQSSRSGQQLLDELHVLPNLALRRRIPEEVRGMERRDQLRAVVAEDPAAQFRDRILGPQQRLRRELSKRDDDFRLDHIDLLEEKGLAGLNLVRLRIAVLRWPALDDVRDVDVVAAEV